MEVAILGVLLLEQGGACACGGEGAKGFVPKEDDDDVNMPPSLLPAGAAEKDPP